MHRASGAAIESRTADIWIRDPRSFPLNLPMNLSHDSFNGPAMKFISDMMPPKLFRNPRRVTRGSAVLVALL